MQNKCCKFCEELKFYDGYYCDIISIFQNSPYIKEEDLESHWCGCFKEREGKFWLYKGAEF